ncbi:hypothetical protein, partial [Tenacibaculum piscium]|uniref:hypothetical protein n=1 Tax=Tenacibaculum piscium TaxID=1458515 RepID=UPI001F16BF3A
TDVKLTQAGKDFLEANGGQELADITLVTTGTSTDKEATNDVVTTLVDDATILTITNGTAKEGETTVGTVMATFTATDADETPVVDFKAGTNDLGHYEIVGTDVKLTQAGKDFLEANGGQELADITLVTTGTSTDKEATNDVVTTLVDDATILTITNGTATEGVTIVGTVMATFTATDADETPVVDFKAGTNDLGHYEIVGTDVKLTQAGKDFLEANGGQELADITLVTTGTSTDKEATNDVVTTLVDDATILTITNGTAKEGETTVGTVMATFTATDADETPVVDFKSGTNDLGHYEIVGTDVKLTQAGKDFLEANGGQELADITLVTTGTSTDKEATNDVVTTLVDDATILTITNGTAKEGETTVGTVMATFTATDADETPVVDFKSGTNDLGHYEIVGTDVKLTQAGKD